MRPVALVVALAMLAMPLTGCLGQGDGTSDEPVQKQRADVTDDLGGIEGVVTDPAVQPVEGATVTMKTSDRSATTSDDGSFAFSRLAPGTHTLVFNQSGFLSTEKTVDVSAGEVTRLDVVLSHTRSETAFTQQFELIGFLECGVGWQTDPNPLPGITQNAIALCSVPTIVAENSTNDKFLHTFKLEAPIDTVVYEMTWNSQGTALSTQMEVEDFPFEDAAEILRAGQTPPVYERLDRPVFDELSRNFTEHCEGKNDTEADDRFCGYTFEATGWPMQMRVFADGNCNDLPARACPVIQEEFRHVISAFYNEPAPDGFAVLPENS